MNGVQKAAALLLSFDKTLAAQVLGLLPRDQADQARSALAAASTPAGDELNLMLLDFKVRFQSRPVLPRHSVAELREPPDLIGDVGSSRRPLPTEPAPAVVPLKESSSGPFAFLEGRHPDDIRLLLREEQSQTIAVIAAQLPPALSAAVLAGLAPDRQAEVLQRVAHLGPTDAEILDDIAAALKDRLTPPRVRAGGVPQAAELLRRSPRPATRSMLNALDEHDADLADELRQTLFSFDDLLKLDDETLRIILQETDDRQWALALKASAAPVRQKVLSCLPPVVAKAFKDEMDSLGPVRLSEMTAVRQQIADSIRRLEDSGLIALPVG
ncbi:MAG: flagellar motor switch protein FliG [Schlesneria sp.]|nr:flagellar motor switch protein FliG [Schlesneria sp.]